MFTFLILGIYEKNCFSELFIDFQYWQLPVFTRKPVHYLKLTIKSHMIIISPKGMGKNLMKVKFISLIIFAMFCNVFSYGQTFILKGGLNLSNVLEKDNDKTYSDDYIMNPGFHFGVIAVFSETTFLSIGAGLMISTKGFRIDEEETFLGITYYSKFMANCYYVDIHPISAKVIFDIGSAKIYGSLGPYIGLGLYGKTKSEVTYSGKTETDEHEVNWGFDAKSSDLKRLDFGLIAGVGTEIDLFMIGISYGYGLANISPDTENGYKFSNRVLSISLGYKFGRNVQGNQ